MKMLRKAMHAAVVLACCGLLAPPGAFAAAPTTAPTSRDITLTTTGSLRGSVLNGEGRPLDGAQVTVHRNGQEVARTVSRVDGSFEIAGMKNGVHELSVGQKVTAVRFWSSEIAPPASRDEAVLVVDNGVRGQDFMGPLPGLDLITLWTVGASTGALVLTIVNQADLNDIQKKLDQMQQNQSP